MSELAKRDPFEEIKPGMQFTGVIDGSFPGGYLITVGVGNCPTLSGVAFTSNHQPAQIERDVNNNNVPIIPTDDTSLPRKNPIENTMKPESWIDINTDKVPPGFEVEHQLISEYSNINKFVPVMLKPVNTSTRSVPINRTNSRDKGKKSASNSTGCRIKIDPFLPRNFPSPALSNLPPSDHAQPNSLFQHSKKSSHMQVTQITT
ncbi:hypothetical protein L195_g039667 [Trifolium pratense]|uniref:Uncharacterized protein n=1 Tax=Trifolium pratense TaxID=57577 RepID=A0A2K3LYM9_TRIPR|nr:hypothetical protein L195_g039667 [Trifolium pratense]